MPDTAPKPFVFVLMPFDGEFQDLYELGIKVACKEAGTYCERVDEQFFDETILQRIYNQISKADIIVAEMTGRNPNVFYEVGYAHALAKTVILLVKDAADIPFDLKIYPHIVYGDSIKGMKVDLKKRIKWVVEHPRKSLMKASAQLRLSLNGKEVRDRATITCSDQFFEPLRIGLFNEGSVVYEAGTISLSIETPRQFEEYNIRDRNWKPAFNMVELPTGRNLFPIPIDRRLFPESWDGIEIHLMQMPGFLPCDFDFRVHSDIGTETMKVFLAPAPAPAKSKDNSAE